MSIKKKFRRRSFMSNPQEQCKIIGVFTVLAAAFIAVNCYVSKHAIQAMHDGIALTDMPATCRSDVAILFEQQTTALNLQLALFTVVTLVMLVLGSVVLSHKIGGPITQLNGYLRGVTNGDTGVRNIKFRKLDFFHSLADNFNSFQEAQGIIPCDAPDKETDAGDKQA